MKLTLLGTAPALASAEQEHIYSLLDGPAGFWLLDCGGSAAHQLLKLGRDPAQLQGLLLTHGHADHIYGLAVFVQDLWLRGRRSPLPIYGNAATIERARSLNELFVPEFMLAFVRYHVIAERSRTRVMETADFRVLATPTIHSFPCLAYRFEPAAGGLALVYGADSAPSAQVVDLARGAGILLHEASVLTTASIDIGHSTAAEAAAVAAEAGVPELWLVHTNPGLHRDGNPYLAEARRVFSGTLRLAKDMDTIDF
ncbi:MAG: ribonuclease Z [Chloroflexi bacterium]|nr:ribonuclease Z [Chloroflexota bacterium]